MACNSNDVANMDSWLFLRKSPDQTIPAHGEGYCFGGSLPTDAPLPE